MLKRLTKYVSNNKLFVLIVILAAALRFSYIDYLPYNAYSILMTGKDEWGVTLPTIFRAYGDYKLPAYIYLTAISEAIFGLNAFAVRLPSVLAGVTTVIFTYLLVSELFSSKNQSPSAKGQAPLITDHPARKSYALSVAGGRSLATVASLLVAIEPWSLFLSRGAFEANLALAFIVSGVYFFLKGIHNSKFLIHSSILLGLSVWTYNSARIFAPLLLALLIYLYKREILEVFRKNRRITIYYLLITIFFFIPMFWQLFNPAGQARYGRVAILDEGAIAQINEARNSSSLSPSPGIIP